MPSSTESQGVSKLDPNLLRSRKPVEIVKLGHCWLSRRGDWCLRATELTSFLYCSDSVYFSFADLSKEETGSLQSPEMHPYSDGELASMDR